MTTRPMMDLSETPTPEQRKADNLMAMCLVAAMVFTAGLCVGMSIGIAMCGQVTK